jgi:DNA-binding transcriptional MerR regulator
VNVKTLHAWDKTGFLSPSVGQARGTGTRRIYSFQDLVAVRVVRELREAGISLQALRKVVAFLRGRRKGVAHPMAETFLLTDGTDVYAKTGDSLLSALRQPGQGLLFHVVNLGRAVDELHEAVLRLQDQETPGPVRGRDQQSQVG